MAKKFHVANKERKSNSINNNDMDKINNLTPKQEKFCKEYVLDFHGTNAAIRAGYNERSAYMIASENLTKDRIRERIQELTKANGEKYDLSLEAVKEQLRRWIWQDSRKYFNEDGSQKHIIDLDDASAAALAGFDMEESFTTEKGVKSLKGVTKKIKRTDQVKAMELLVKILGYAAPVKTDITVSAPMTPEQLKELINSLRENKAQ